MLNTALMALRLLSAFVLLVGFEALGQTPQALRIAITRVEEPNLDTYTFAAAHCNDTLSLAWSNTLLINLTQCGANPLKLWATAGECLDSPSAADTLYDDVQSLDLNGGSRNGTFKAKIAELPGFKIESLPDGGMTLPCSGQVSSTKTHRICGSVEYATSTGYSCGSPTKVRATPLKLVFDSLAPAPPKIISEEGQERSIRLGFSVDSDTATVTMEVKGPDDSDYRVMAETLATVGWIRAEGLQNGVVYEARLRAIDAAGNQSDASSSAQVKPIHTLGLWGKYKQVGGTDEGGCSVGLGLMPLAAVIALCCRRRRPRGLLR